MLDRGTATLVVVLLAAYLTEASKVGLRPASVPVKIDMRLHLDWSPEQETPPDGPDHNRWWLQRMLFVVSKLFARRNLVWWVSHGTLLGAARHRGPLPGEDDVDIDTLVEYFETINTMGMKADFAINGLDVRIHTRVRAISLVPFGAVKPRLDICFVINRPPLNLTVQYYSYPSFHRLFWFPPGHKYYFKTLRFGYLKVPVMELYVHYLNKMYGYDWNITMKEDCRLPDKVAGKCTGGMVSVQPQHRTPLPLVKSPRSFVWMYEDLLPDCIDVGIVAIR